MSRRRGPRRSRWAPSCRALGEEFPDITISKVRFLEAEGLVTPGPHGVRLPPVHRRRRRAAPLRPARAARPLLAAQGGHQGHPRGHRPRPDPGRRRRPDPARPTPPDPAVPAAADLLATPAPSGSPLPSWPAASGLAASVVADLTPTDCCDPDPDGLYGEPDLRVAPHAAAGLAAYGLEARHLRLFRTAADREVGLVEQAVGRRRRAEGDRWPPRWPTCADPPRRPGPWGLPPRAHRGTVRV